MTKECFGRSGGTDSVPSQDSGTTQRSSLQHSTRARANALTTSPTPSFDIRAWSLLQPSFVELDQVEIRLDIFPTFPAGFLEKMKESSALCGGIRVTGDHALVPLLNR